MVSKTVKVVNSQGFHMRPATMFVNEMMKFDSDINLISGDKKANAKSLMMIVAAAFKCGMEVEVTAEGADEEAALAKAVELIEDGLGED